MLPSRPSAVSQLRHRAAGFAAAAGASDEVTAAIALAVSETVTNVILHAYDGEDGQVRVSCQVDGERFIVEVVDDGGGIAPRRDSPGIGHGLAIVGALAQTLDFAPGGHGRGTAVRMVFGPVRPTDAPPGLEALCALALETVADVSCVDVVREGVLRRVGCRGRGRSRADRVAVRSGASGEAGDGDVGGAARGRRAPGRPRPGLSRARRAVPESASTSPGGSRSRSRTPTERQPRCGASAAARADGPCRPRRSSAILADAARGDLAQPAERATAARSARHSASVTACFWQLAPEDCASGDATGRTWSA